MASRENKSATTASNESIATGLAGGMATQGTGEVVNSAIMFVDVVSSSEFASVMPVREYAAYIDSFHQICLEQCEHFFSVVHRDRYSRRGIDHEYYSVGDEMVVFAETEDPGNDVYHLICLAVALKCGWLGVPMNLRRLREGLPAAELAIGINHGKIFRAEAGRRRTGYAINLAKRAETVSRTGLHTRIAVTDPAFKTINRRQRHLLFGPRIVESMKGVVVPVGYYELTAAFVNATRRMPEALSTGFADAARQALRTSTYDSWIHGCLQVVEESRNSKVTDECLALCENALSIDARDPIALYYAGQGHAERGDDARASLYFHDLTRAWPRFGDGWLELARTSSRLGEADRSRHALLEARRCGVDDLLMATPPDA